jgi:acyl carrier protein
MNRVAIHDLLLRFLRDDLGVDESDLGPETPLVTTGLVDSAGLVRLAALLEDATGIVIPDRDITADHFDTLARIVAYLAARGVS